MGSRIVELTDIQKIMDQFENSDIRELKIDDGSFHLYLNKNRLNQTVNSESVSSARAKEEVTEEIPAQEAKAENAEPDENLTGVKAPIVGMVYLQAKPGQAPFVKPGNHINAGDTVCIIEAMKMMTEVRSEVSGVVKSIEVENEDLVEVDQPLILVKED